MQRVRGMPRRCTTSQTICCGLSHSTGTIVRERRRESFVGAGCGEQFVGFLSERLYSVGASWPPLRRLGTASKLYQSCGQFCGVTTLLTVHALPSGDCGARGLRVVGN